MEDVDDKQEDFNTGNRLQWLTSEQSYTHQVRKPLDLGFNSHITTPTVAPLLLHFWRLSRGKKMP